MRRHQLSFEDLHQLVYLLEEDMANGCFSFGPYSDFSGDFSRLSAKGKTDAQTLALKFAAST